MSTENLAVQPADTPSDPASTPTPTVTHYQQVAQALLKSLDDIGALIPNLTAEHPATATFVRTHQNVSNEFLATVLAAVEATPALQGVNQFDVTAARDTLQFIEAFRPAADRLAAFAAALGFTIKSRRAALVASSQQMYAIAQGVVRAPGSSDLVAHVENMKRDLGRKGRKKKAEPQAPATPPAHMEEQHSPSAGPRS